jgi:hypothetical protein
MMKVTGGMPKRWVAGIVGFSSRKGLINVYMVAGCGGAY